MALIVAMLVLPAASARAGTYDVVACSAPGAGGENHSWALETYNVSGKALPDLSSFKPYDGDVTRCSATTGIGVNSLAASKVTVKYDDGAGWTFRAPAGTTVARMQIWRYSSARASADDATTPAAENGVWNVAARIGTTAGAGTLIGTESCSGAAPVAPDTYCHTGTAAFTLPGSATYDVGEPVVTLGFECKGPTPSSLCFTATPDPAPAAHAGYELRGAKMTIDDPIAPAVSSGAADGAYHRPAEPITAGASDSAGVRALRVLVDGTAWATEQYACDFRYASPCPLAPTRPFDLSGVTDGRHTLTTIAQDTAGNVSRTDRTIDLDGTPPVVSEVPVSGRTISAVVSDALSGVAGGTIEIRGGSDAPFVALKTTLRGGKLVATVPKSVKDSYGIRVSGSDKAGNVMSALVTSMSLSTRVGRGHARKVRNERATIPYGRTVSVLGRLTSTDGSPIANQPIVVTGTLRQNGATSQPVATATTDTGGRYSVTIPAGPSRTLAVAYPGAPGILARTRTVSLRVPANATIHASASSIRGAGSVRFSGRLRALGTSLPPGGKIVDLEASQSGRWSTVATTRATGPSGAWRATAHFRGNPGRFPIRLRIRREALFPYALGYSASVVVRVR